MRLVRASSMDAPWLATSNSGHSATKTSSSRSIIAVKRCTGPMVPSLFHALDLRSRAGQFRLDPLIAAVDVVHAVDHRLAARYQRTQHQRRAGPQVRRDDSGAGQLARAGHDG